MTATDIERLEHAARSVFGHEEMDGGERDEMTQAKTPSLLARMLDYLQKRTSVAPSALS
ncbi:hypothetical protein ACLE20_06430 [Rhizobium sp. YIM 134829]|uniref:hypothetical protein n=1 Tax=Rhizobium sp. YIM 134829 TaxID=3390453 RepID=UPI00397DD4C9